ncbi:MAG TPA: nucleotidyltransferase family protein, partial [Candidatus Mcinerneyibacteriales bacterium]|nr:nucleotidyltransferase family protein [Candidatus Mcinerneyibacteriales bacterium]
LPEEGSYEGLVTAVGTKRYTDATIKRALLAAFLGLTKEEFGDMNGLNYPYIRILGRTENGNRLLAEIRRSSSVPFIHNENRYPWKKYYTKKTSLDLFRGLETKAENLYRMLLHEM